MTQKLSAPLPTEKTLVAVACTLGAHFRRRYGAAVHKLSLDAGFSCPNRDGSRDIGGCTFCNNRSFSPTRGRGGDLAAQIRQGRSELASKTGARLYLAYFQSYTNTHAEIGQLDRLYRQAMQDHDVVGLSVATRPDCLPQTVVDLLRGYQDAGKEVWLELGLQSSFDTSLARIRRGHGYAEYRDAVRRARAAGLQVCTHLILGLPGERPHHALTTLERVLDDGVDGLKLHPLHLVRGTEMVRQWRAGEFRLWSMQDYVETAASLIRRTPAGVIYHRVTAAARAADLVAPDWCEGRWKVLNAIVDNLYRTGAQGSEARYPAPSPGELHACI